jgi:transcriptional regulator with XRE-family HTH domain
MNEQQARLVGARVRARRVANRQTQAVVAGLAGISTDYLYQIERGRKLPAVSVLTELARVLNVSVATLLDERRTTSRGRPDVTDTGAQLYRALTQPITFIEPPTLAELEGQVRSAWRIWQTSPRRYSALAERLPTLIAKSDLVERQYRNMGTENERRLAHGCAVDLYCLLRTVAKRVGRMDLSLLVADRAVRSAETIDDPLRLAAARWNLAHVLLADDQPQGAEDVTMQAVDALNPLIRACDGEAMALSGALTLLGAMSSSRAGKVDEARERVRSVVPLATRTGECNVCWTAFGPTNVAMYAVSVEAEAGEAAEALRLAEQVDRARSPSIERRVAFVLEQAESHARRRDFASALVLLHTVGREAPEDVVHRPAVRHLVHTVVQRGRRSIAAEAMSFAEQVGVALE